MLPLKQLACQGAAEVIFYDQAGCGESLLPVGTSVAGDFPHLLDMSYYSQEELPALIDHWKLDRYHLLGNSWGTIVAQQFALDSDHTDGLVSLMLSGPLSDGQSYINAQWNEAEGNLASLPPFIQSRIHSLEEEGKYDSPEYEAIATVLGTYFTIRTNPFPDCFQASMDALSADAAVDIYVGIQGPSEFALSGPLGDMNFTSRLHEIAVPTLLTHGKFDTMRPSIVKTIQRQIHLAERKVLPHSGHISMVDDAGLMNEVIADFFSRVEDAERDETNEGAFEPKIWEDEERSTTAQESSTMSASALKTPAWVLPTLTAALAFALGLGLGKCHQQSKSGYAPIE